MISYLPGWQKDLIGKERRNLEGRCCNLNIKIGRVPLENSSVISIQVLCLDLNKLSQTQDDPSFQNWLTNIRARAWTFLNRISSREGTCVRTLLHCFATMSSDSSQNLEELRWKKEKENSLSRQTHWSFYVKVLMRFSM